MNTLNFAVEFKLALIFSSNLQKVSSISLKGEIIGYINEELPPVTDSTIEPIFTPFTSSGLLDESHCMGCAAKAIFANHTGLTAETVDIADAVDNPAHTLFAVLIGSALARQSRMHP